MAQVQVPLDFGVPAFEFKVELDAVPYTFVFSYNDRNAKWTFNLLDDAGEELLLGIPVIVKQLLLERYKYDTRIPQGDLFLLNIVNDDQDADDTNLGTDVLLLYEEAS